MAIALNGKSLAQKWLQATQKRVVGLTVKQHSVGLAIILIGDNSASARYLARNLQQAKQIGIQTFVFQFKRYEKPSLVLTKIKELNQDQRISGILVQLPLPDNFDQVKLLSAIAPQKDVDGVHPLNLGRLWLGQSQCMPATVHGIIKLLDAYQLALNDRHVVILGRSLIVGKPLAGVLINRNATVTLAHSHTSNLQSLTQKADILIAALGRAHFVTPAFIKPGAIVIDVGTNQVAGHLQGDVDLKVEEKAGYLTPVPGGVGPMTVAALMSQTVDLAELRWSRE